MPLGYTTTYLEPSVVLPTNTQHLTELVHGFIQRLCLFLQRLPRDLHTFEDVFAAFLNRERPGFDVAKRRLHLDVPEDELDRRRAAWRPPDLGVTRGYVKLYIEEVEQANKGVDFRFLSGHSGSAVPRDSH